MQIKVKTLKGQMVEVPAEADTLVSELKARIEGALPRGEAPAGNQRVIHKGKELEDGSTVGSHGISEHDFLVVMVRKKAATAAPAAAPAAAAPAPASAPAPAEAPAPAPAPTDPPPALVEQLKEMGFPESQVVAALRASGNDPTVAIEFLFSGNIPASSVAEEAAVDGGTGVDLAAGSGRGGRGNPATVAQLLSSPQFQELQRLVRETPTELETAVGALATTNPDLLRLLNDDPESFWEALLGAEGMETGDEGDDEDDDEDEEAEAMIEAGGAVLTAEDEAAIARLQEMGFDREQAVQAYLLAGKDETLAVNMLLGA